MTMQIIGHDFSGQIFLIFEIIIFCFVVTICDLVHDVEAICSLTGVTHISEKISKCF